MSLLLPLTGIAIPKTPPYRIAGNLDYAEGVVKFDQFTGKVGSSDLEGNIDVDTKPQRPVLNATLQSRLVDLKDLGGFIGAQPRRRAEGHEGAHARPGPTTAASCRATPSASHALTSPTCTSSTRPPVSEGQRQPLENMVANLDIVNGDITLKPLSFGIGRGNISGNIALAEKSNELSANATIDFQRVDVERLLAATGVGHGAGTIGGRAVIVGQGHSIAEILGRGNGELKLYMGRGGDLSALLVDISGLQFGNAFLSAIGVPNRAQIECLILDFPLQQGIATARTALLDTDEARVGINGSVNLHDEVLKLAVKTESKHFSVGSLPTPIDIDGTLGKPSIAPEAGPLALRGGAAVALGIVATPLAALLPTIQFGTGEDGACSGLTREIQTPPRVTPPARVTPVRRGPAPARPAVRR